MIYGEKFHRKNPPFLYHSFYFVFIYLCIFQSCLFETAEVKWLRSSTFNGLELTSVNFFTPVANCLIACIWEQAAVLFYVVLLLVVHVVFHLFHVIKEKRKKFIAILPISSTTYLLHDFNLPLLL